MRPRRCRWTFRTRTPRWRPGAPGLELDEATAEEEAAERLAAEAPAAEDRFAGKSKEELVALFGKMLGEQPCRRCGATWRR